MEVDESQMLIDSDDPDLGSGNDKAAGALSLILSCYKSLGSALGGTAVANGTAVADGTAVAWAC